MSSQSSGNGSGLPARSAADCGSSGGLLSDHLQHVIHDDVMQSLGISMLQAELCRRLWENGREPEALEELQGRRREIEAAVGELRHVMRDLHAATGPRSRSA